MKQSARNLFISLQLNHLQINARGFTTPGDFSFSPVFVGGSIYRRHLKAAAANRTLFQNHQAHFFWMVGGIFATCTSGLNCICGVEQGIKAREGGGASFQPTAVVHGGHVYLHDYRLQTNSSLFSNLSRLTIESTYWNLKARKEMGGGCRIKTIYVHDDLSGLHSWMTWVLFLFGVARGRKNCLLQH